jgi:alanyl-tRNA synthetase
MERQGHAIIPSAPIVPENDPTTLFTSSGMQPLVPYLLGKDHPKGNRIANSQKSFRAEDIEEVGDNRHTTFFEMLGNWSLGDYWKKEQLAWFYQFLTEELKLPKEKLWVTCFLGDEKTGISRDTESMEVWKSLGVSEDRILFYPAKKNWWSRAGVPENMPVGEPGGPDSEMFYDFGTPHDPSFGESCHPNCDCGRFMEIGNSVFMEYIKKEDGTFGQLPKKNVDFGGGLERLTAATLNDPDMFMIDVFEKPRKHIEAETGKSYENETHSFRVILDHVRAAIFMIADGVEPSNTEQGYVLRRLLRRSVLRMNQLHSDKSISALIASFVDAYQDHYPILKEKQSTIGQIVTREETKFAATLGRGMREFEKMGKNVDAFILFTTYGFPLELTQELAQERGISIDQEAFKKEFEKHQQESRAGAEQKFKGGLADASEKTTALHTATHLMLAGLRKYLGDHVHQAGSNITQERTRFDFTHPEKVSREVLDQVEVYVNEALSKEAEMVVEQVPKEEAQKRGVEGSFWEKYPDVVNVYTVRASDGTIYSQELCGGPHVGNTREIQGTFKIQKEEASSAGVRRVKAVLE